MLDDGHFSTPEQNKTNEISASKLLCLEVKLKGMEQNFTGNCHHEAKQQKLAMQVNVEPETVFESSNSVKTLSGYCKF